MLINDLLPIQSESQSEELKDQNLQSKKDDTPLILVVDDEPINIEVLCMMMAAKG